MQPYTLHRMWSDLARWHAVLISCWHPPQGDEVVPRQRERPAGVAQSSSSDRSSTWEVALPCWGAAEEEDWTRVGNCRGCGSSEVNTPSSPGVRVTGEGAAPLALWVH
jgi:hypothetical protein